MYACNNTFTHQTASILTFYSLLHWGNTLSHHNSCLSQEGNCSISGHCPEN